MKKTILLTGATDGIGLETAKQLINDDTTLLIHGRSDQKLVNTKNILSDISRSANVETYCADLSNLSEVGAMASAVVEKHPTIDILINNAGVYKTQTPVTSEGYDIRFIVNTVAPYLLTKRLLPNFSSQSRVINLSSAAQASVDLEALNGKVRLSDDQAYAQSKLAITMWSFFLANELGDKAPTIVAVNPASFLGSKMVKDAYGMDGKDLSIGADILFRAALSDEFANASGRYYDNDRGEFAQPHADALDAVKTEQLILNLEKLVTGLVLNEK